MIRFRILDFGLRNETDDWIMIAEGGLRNAECGMKTDEWK
ncbi:hypothetical protein D1AOALGA4SA_9876 [Olavius algarvensis Delta 1 endosymbiont]|nr:hypothetical protein D1AOALGA4SA_9876 [Olavius algarvensis Delta 1 endosymbiont]